ncbi:MAG: hypothetical protein RR922_01165 [Clostridia bacterium]
MENTTKAILIGVGLFITIALISAVLVIMGVGNNLIKGSSSDLNGIADTLKKELTSSFDDKVVTGAEVKSTMSQYEKSTKLTVYLDNDESNTTVKFNATKPTKGGMQGQVGYKNLSGASKQGNAAEYTVKSYTGAPNLTSDLRIKTNWLSDSSSGLYVQPQSTYQANLCYSNGELVGIVFKKLA